MDSDRFGNYVNGHHVKISEKRKTKCIYGFFEEIMGFLTTLMQLRHFSKSIVFYNCTRSPAARSTCREFP